MAESYQVKLGGPKIGNILQVISILVFILLVLACGKSAPRDPLELMKLSVERMYEIKSFRAQMDMEIESQGEKASLNARMELGKNQRSRVLMTIDIADEQEEVEAIFTEAHIFSKLSDERWVRFDAESFEESTGLSIKQISDPQGFVGNLFPVDEVRWEVYTIKSLGREKVETAQTEHLSIQFDYEDLVQQLSEDKKRDLFESFGLGGGDFEDLLSTVQINEFEVWIDDDGHIRRVVLEMTFRNPGSGDSVSSKIDMKMFDFNKNIDVVLPSSYEDITDY